MNKIVEKVVVIILIIASIYTIISVNKKRYSNYNLNCYTVIGRITKISKSDESIKITLMDDDKEIINGVYYINNLKLDLELNDYVKLEGELNIPDTNEVENTFNYRKYLYSINSFYTINISRIEVLEKNKNIFFKIKNKLVRRINEYQSKDFLNAFILGDKSDIDGYVSSSFQINGINHLFSVSGMHVSLLSSIILLILKKLKVNENLSLIIVVILLLFYSFLTSFTPSVLRSFLLYLMLSIKNKFNINIRTHYVLLLVMSIVLFINPFYIYNIGFQYSFSISFFLILFSSKISKNYIKGLFDVSLIAFLVSLPINIINNYYVNFLAILYNLFYVPFVSIIVFPFSFIVLLFKSLEPIYLVLTNIIKESSLNLSHFDIFKIILMKPSIYIIILYYLVIIISLFKNKFLIILVVIIMIHANFNIFNKNSFMEMIDVDQGDSFLLYSDNKTMLIDTGSGFSDSRTIPYLMSIGVKKIDYLVLTHGDKDHLGDAINLVNKFRVGYVYLNSNSYNTNELELINVLKSKHINYSKLEEGSVIKLNQFSLISLNTDLFDENDSSIVFLASINNYRVLLTGDASTLTEEYILNKYNLGHVDILKVGHHGSYTSTSSNLLSTIKPDYAFISVGEKNIYSHPNGDVVKRIEDANTKIYRTDVNNSCKVTFKNELKIKCLNE